MQPQPTLIYDNNCRLCQAALARAAATGALDNITVRGRTELTAADFHTLNTTPQRCEQEIVLIRPEGTVGGAEAALAVLARAKHPKIIAQLAAFPPLRALAPKLYRAIARNRALLSALFFRP